MLFCFGLLDDECFGLIGNNRQVEYIGMEVFIIEHMWNLYTSGGVGNFEVDIVRIIGVVIRAFAFYKFLGFWQFEYTAWVGCVVLTFSGLGATCSHRW